MTDDDWIKTANYMTQKAKDEMEFPRGGFMTAYWGMVRHAADAYVRADGSNQRLMRRQLALLFEEFDNARRNG